MELNHHALQQAERKYKRAILRTISQKLLLIMTYLLMIMSFLCSAQSAAFVAHQKNQQQNLTQIKPPSAAKGAVAKNAQVSAEHPVHILFPLPTDDGPHNDNNPFGLTVLKARPVVDEAVDTVYRRQFLPPGSLAIHFEADNQGEPTGGGPNLAIGKLLDNRLDCVIGYASVYSLAPVARMSPYWRDRDSDGIPVISSAGLASYFDNRLLEYQLLTRISGSYKTVASAVLSLFQAMGWKRSSYLLHEQRHNNALNPNIPFGECHRLITSINPYLYRLNKMENNLFTFDELSSGRRERIKENLRKASRVSNVIILCARPDTVRDIMLAAHELGMATSGDYAFINIDVAHPSNGSSSMCKGKPCWLGQANNNSSNNMTNRAEQNEKAKVAYRALKTIALRQSNLEQEEYKQIEARVKQRAEEKYNYSSMTGKEYEMNYFVSVLSDALLLYAIALNETLAEGLDPRNGKIITSKMWNRTFAGMAGKVSIDPSGDRCSDYSLLEVDPAQHDKIVEVAFYSANSKGLKHITQFHWLGEKPPKDVPVCGWDHSECPGGYPPAHVFAMIGLAFLVLILLSGFVIMFFKWPTARSWHQNEAEQRAKMDGLLAEQCQQQENGH